ncbi:MAG: branched-chain amino acid aminotransferase [Candidatus Neomarinimicrobiota bacterium]|jgi:branched-chain amino acid aminotransferase|nr:branched-chain amino acid aminotransferase [Candidatus Neomarinimicrobiota bacterium]MDD3965616.1 branched-chain amino acid aminotransferase [Candidatus Neomarinimicrobiota bacterium]MDX9779402.1 branched-chain amino acid aminotransferase [bacterium]
MNVKMRSVSKLPEIDFSNLGFGKYYGDHMLLRRYKDGAWQESEILPYEEILLSPANITLHYAQSIFEGMKAFRGEDGIVRLFRPEQNIARLNRSAERMAIPQIDEKKTLEELIRLITLDQDFTPPHRGSSLYIRPFIFATDPSLGVKISETYNFMIITTPVDAYYGRNLQTVGIYATKEFTRAAPGGTGHVKAAANYAQSLYAAKRAQQKGYKQIMWLDGLEHKYVDEVGTMNIMFVINDTLITPTLKQGTILAGITRDSVLQLARDLGWKVEERRIAFKEIIKAAKKGQLQECFGTGTAATIAPVGHIGYDEGEDIVINNNEVGPYAKTIYEQLLGIQYGKLEDRYGWTVKIKKK